MIMNNGKGQGDFRTLILAAGQGTRMKSPLVKVLHPLQGKPMLGYVVEVARKAGSGETLVIVGYQAGAVKERFAGEGLIFVEQREQLGTGHAVRQAQEQLAAYDGSLIILCGDVPLLRPATVRALFEQHGKGKTAVTLLTTILEDPTGYGRIIKGRHGEAKRIVEDRDATPAEKKIREINTGIYCVESKFLFSALAQITNHNAQREYYLTDIVALAHEGGGGADTLVAPDPREVMGINTPEELQRAELALEAIAGR